jgi:tripartite-type tricarboxylate transporter receptor subunit TctC
VQAVTADVATTFPQVKAGQLQMLGIASNKPHASFSDVALYQDQGIGLTIGLWRLVVAPSGTPSDVIQILQDAYLKAIRTPEFRKVVGASLVRGLPSKEAARKMEEYSMTMKALVDKLDLATKR